MKVKPLGDRVLIEREEAEAKTQSGIVLPGAKEAPQMGKVLAVGPGTSEVKMEVKTGDKVIFAKYAGTEIKIDGKELLLLSQSDVLAVVDK